MIEEEVGNALSEFEQNAPDPEELERLRAFFEEMKRAGLVRQRGYDLPPLDTIGKTAHRIQRRDR